MLSESWFFQPRDALDIVRSRFLVSGSSCQNMGNIVPAISGTLFTI